MKQILYVRVIFVCTFLMMTVVGCGNQDLDTKKRNPSDPSPANYDVDGQSPNDKSPTNNDTSNDDTPNDRTTPTPEPTPEPTPPTNAKFDWRQVIKLDKIPTYAFSGNSFGSATYRDIMEHTPASQRFLTSGRSTQAHESQHGLVSVMRNATRVDDGFFYFEAGTGAYVLQPKKVMAKVKDYVGARFKQEARDRYDLYLVKQATSWPEVLYLFDEWNAYVATARTSIELVQAGQWDNENSDPFDGLADFLYFCSAAVVTLHDLDPTFIEQNIQFKATYAMLVEQSQKLISEGTKINLFKNSVSLRRVEMLKRDDESARIRKTLEAYMGREWYDAFMKPL